MGARKPNELHDGNRSRESVWLDSVDLPRARKTFPNAPS